ncbi:MAG: hypothetical protein ABIB71_09410 [Candidatus Woesearchaeota archaeon]
MTSFKIIKNEIKLEKEITKLDEFVLDLIGVISKYANYVIISGYVSIFFGRARGTEDVDMFMEEIPLKKFLAIYKELTEKGYDFTIDDAEELYHGYLKYGLPINIWKKGFPLLRLETKFALKMSQKMAIREKVKVVFISHELYFGGIESQIAYKRYIAKSDKDLKDARHLEVVFLDLSKEKIEHYRKIFEAEFK